MVYSNSWVAASCITSQYVWESENEKQIKKKRQVQDKVLVPARSPARQEPRLRFTQVSIHAPPPSLTRNQAHASLILDGNLGLSALRLAGTALTSLLRPGEVDDRDLEEGVAIDWSAGEQHTNAPTCLEGTNLLS